MFRVMKAMLAEFSYLLEKYCGVTSILWSIIFMSICCSMVFMTLVKALEILCEKKKKQNIEGGLQASNSKLEKKYQTFSCVSSVLKKTYGLYPLYVCIISLCSYFFNKLVTFAYTWDSKLQRVMSNFTYILSFKSNRRLFLNALSLPDNSFNQKHLFNIALYLNDNQWTDVMQSLGSEKWYFEKVRKAIIEILHIGKYHLSLGIFYQDMLAYIPVALIAILGVAFIIKNYKVDGIITIIAAVICIFYNLGTGIFVCIAIYLGILIKVWFETLKKRNQKGTV